MVSRTVVAAIVLAVCVSPTIKHLSVLGAFRVWFRLVLVYREVAGVFGFFCAGAAVSIFSLGELLVPSFSQRLFLSVAPASIDLSPPILVSVVISRVLIIVIFILIQRDGSFVEFFPGETQETIPLTKTHQQPTFS